MIIAEIATWLSRLAGLVPQFIMLWQAAETGDPDQELRAQLNLTRAVKDAQMREALERSPP